MPFNNKDFSVLAYSNGFTLWNYAGKDPISSVKEEGYFAPLAPFARAGDVIFISAPSSNGEVSSAILNICKIDNGNVFVKPVLLN